MAIRQSSLMLMTRNLFVNVLTGGLVAQCYALLLGSAGFTIPEVSPGIKYPSSCSFLSSFLGPIFSFLQFTLKGTAVPLPRAVGSRAQARTRTA